MSVAVAGSTRLYVFLSLRTTSQAVYAKVKTAFRLSVVLLCLAMVSMASGLLGKRYTYAIVANLTPLLFPVVLLEGAQQKLWGKELLKVQCLLATVYGLTLIILDSIILAFVVTNFRYCYGDWRDKCDSYDGSGSLSLVCHSSAAPASSSGLFVYCESRENYVLQLISLGLNLIHSLGIAPYLLMCHGVRVALNSALPAWRDGSILVLDPLPETMEVTPSRAMVLLGREEALEEEELTQGLPVPLKATGHLTDDSQADISVSRMRLKPHD